MPIILEDEEEQVVKDTIEYQVTDIQITMTLKNGDVIEKEFAGELATKITKNPILHDMLYE